MVSGRASTSWIDWARPSVHKDLSRVTVIAIITLRTGASYFGEGIRMIKDTPPVGSRSVSGETGVEAEE